MTKQPVDLSVCKSIISVKKHKAGTEIIWKNVKIITDNVSKYSKKSTLSPITTLNKLTNDEKKTWMENYYGMERPLMAGEEQD